jgi:anti-sigma B factor antagonist
VADSTSMVLASDSRSRPARAPHADAVGAFGVVGYGNSGGTVFLLTGELDIATVPALASFLRRVSPAERAHLVVDLAGLTFCDCSGLTALLRAHHRAVADGGWLRLCAASSRFQRLLKLTNLSAALLCYPTIGDAFAAPDTYRPELRDDSGPVDCRPAETRSVSTVHEVL